MQHLEPLMERYGVSAYFAGHDHNLEHLQLENGLHIFVSGGGSDCDRGFLTDVDAKYQYKDQGFAAATISSHKELKVSFYTLKSGMNAAYTATILPPSRH